jgi:hypothetical protein
VNFSLQTASRRLLKPNKVVRLTGHLKPINVIIVTFLQ